MGVVATDHLVVSGVRRYIALAEICRLTQHRFLSLLFSLQQLHVCQILHLIVIELLLILELHLAPHQLMLNLIFTGLTSCIVSLRDGGALTIVLVVLVVSACSLIKLRAGSHVTARTP